MILLKMNWQRGWFCPSTKKAEQGMNVISAYVNGFEYGGDTSGVINIWELLYQENQGFCEIYDYDIASNEIRRYMLEKGVKRVIYYPFSQNGIYVGCVVFEDCRENGTEADEESLKQIQSVCRLLDACIIHLR